MVGTMEDPARGITNMHPQSQPWEDAMVTGPLQGSWWRASGITSWSGGVGSVDPSTGGFNPKQQI